MFQGERKFPQPQLLCRRQKDGTVQRGKRKLRSFPQYEKQLGQKRFFQTLFGERQSGKQE